jgi:hypothetical protein
MDRGNARKDIVSDDTAKLGCVTSITIVAANQGVKFSATPSSQEVGS